MKKKKHKNPNFSYINSNGKKVSGTAAALHEIYTVQGGLGNYNNNIGKEYISAFVDAHSDIINAGIEAMSRRKKLHVVNK